MASDPKTTVLLNDWERLVSRQLKGAEPPALSLLALICSDLYHQPIGIA